MKTSFSATWKNKNKQFMPPFSHSLNYILPLHANKDLVLWLDPSGPLLWLAPFMHNTVVCLKDSPCLKTKTPPLNTLWLQLSNPPFLWWRLVIWFRSLKTCTSWHDDEILSCVPSVAYQSSMFLLTRFQTRHHSSHRRLQFPFLKSTFLKRNSYLVWL